MKQVRLLRYVVAMMPLLVTNTSWAGIINPANATTSSNFTGSLNQNNIFNTAHLDAGNLHLIGAFGGNGAWLSANGVTGDQWLFADLGGLFDVSEVRIWNYNENEPTQPVDGRGINDYAMFFAGAGAILPSGLSSTPFTAPNGWSAGPSGTLAIGPNSGGPFGPTDTLSVSQTGVQYIGIDVGSRHHVDPFSAGAVGISQIQAFQSDASTAVPEPGAFALMSIGSIGFVVYRRRRKQKHTPSGVER